MENKKEEEEKREVEKKEKELIVQSPQAIRTHLLFLPDLECPLNDCSQLQL